MASVVRGKLNLVRNRAFTFLKRKGDGVRSLDDRREVRMMTMKSDSPLRTIKFRPLPRSRKTEHVRPLKTIHIPPPPRGERRPLRTIHIRPTLPLLVTLVVTHST